MKVSKKLANTYIVQGIFPDKYLDDSLHGATASYFGISYII